ncbi:MAG: AmmeMemoRadiSam system protein B [Deltaproteobacteria bacterium]|nr:AmmeMemoRadiSam system protein B [Deltaproteobacteria bacterium]
MREPAVSGRFYPSEPRTLRESVVSYLGDCSREREAIVVVAPHAGYVYSGAIAGAAYAAARVPETVVVLGPNHTGAGARAAIITAGRFRTPSGDIAIDERLAGLVREKADLTEDTRAHAREHGIEVHLPFLWERRAEVRIVPICLGGLAYEDCARLGKAIADAVRAVGGRVLIVSSTDMSHYVPATVAARLDGLAIDRALSLDAPGLYETVTRHDISMCGLVPTTVALEAARDLGASDAELVRYGNSGDVNGDVDHVVGYAGLVVS